MPKCCACHAIQTLRNLRAAVLNGRVRIAALNRGWHTPGPAAGGRHCASLSLLRFRKAGVLPRRPASGPGGARRRRLRARRKPAPLLLTRPGLPALLAAPGGAQSGQALLLRAPPDGRSVGLPAHTSCCATASRESGPRAASAAPADKRDRATPGRAGLSTRSALPGAAALYLCRPSLHLPRSQHELLWHEEAGA